MAYATQTIRQRIPRGNKLASWWKNSPKKISYSLKFAFVGSHVTTRGVRSQHLKWKGKNRLVITIAMFDTDKMCFLRARLVYSDSI